MNHRTHFIRKIVVDAKSGMPFRLEHWSELHPDRKSITFYRFDLTIAIERPKIDLEARRLASIKAFEQSIQSSNSTCRQEVHDILERGNSTIPFEYQVTFPHYDQISRLSGVFVPPNSLYQKWEGIWDHGINGTELVSISDRLWMYGELVRDASPPLFDPELFVVVRPPKQIFDISIALGARPVKGGCHKSF